MSGHSEDDILPDLYRIVYETNDRSMATSLPCEINKYNKNVRYLKRLLRDTQISLEDIRNNGSFYREYLASAQISPEDLEQISASIERPPCIIIHGQNCFTKNCVVNELFNKNILPIVSNVDQHTWRMVTFKYGQCNQISLALPDSYELIDHLQGLEQPWRTVPTVDLELTEHARGDPASEIAHLEIRIKHPLLKENVEVVVTPSNNPRHNFSTLFASYLERVLPIVLYAISEDSLSEKDKEDLKAIKNLQPDLPIAFVKVKTASMADLTESEQHAQSEKQKLMRQQLQYQLRSPYSKRRRAKISPENSLDLFQQLCDLGKIASYSIFFT